MVSAVVSQPQTEMQIPEPRAEQGQTSDQTNVGQIERAVSVMGGSLLVANGIKRLSLLGLGIAGLGAALIQRGATGKCPMYKALNVTTATSGNKWRSHPLSQQIRVEKSVTVNRPAEEVYRFWRKLENLPTFMKHVKSVKEVDEKRSHWQARGARGRTVEWNADIVADVPNERIAWKSVAGGDVQTAGQVLFEPAGKETRVKVVMEYAPPAGVLGVALAMMFGEDPSHTVKEDLRRFKQVMETGEIPTMDGQPQGSCAHAR